MNPPGGAITVRVFAALATAILAVAGLRADAGSGAEFLLVEPSARAAGMAGAEAADGGQLDGLVYNPAGLAGLTGLQASMSHLAAGGDWTHDWLAIGLPWGPVVLGADLLVSRLEPFTLYNGSGQAYDTATVDSQNFGLALAASPLPWLHAGATLRCFHSQLYTYQSTGYALDAGLQLNQKNSPLSAGLALQNLGSQSAYAVQADPLPLLVRAGLQAAVPVDRDLSVAPRLDFISYQDSGRPVELRLGADFSLFRQVFLRAGWIHAGSFAQPCLGLGVAWQSFVLDYAYQGEDDLGASQMLELQYVGP